MVGLTSSVILTYPRQCRRMDSCIVALQNFNRTVMPALQSSGYTTTTTTTMLFLISATSEAAETGTGTLPKNMRIILLSAHYGHSDLATTSGGATTSRRGRRPYPV